MEGIETRGIEIRGIETRGIETRVARIVFKTFNK